MKKSLNSGSRIDSDELYKKIERYDFVSFDIFDTLVKRNVAEPADIFGIMERSVGGDFKLKRIKAEKKARIELGRPEIVIEDIYSYFPVSERKMLEKLELDTEFQAIVPNSPIAEVYRSCVNAGKTIFILSDMYWPENAVRELLQRNGFTDYKSLYLSSRYQRTKRDGALFHQLLEQEGIEPGQLVHIGDSPKSDYAEPRKLGIHAQRIPRYFCNIEFRGTDKKDKLELNYINHFINNTFPYTEDPYYRFGYSQFGKLLYGFAHWLHEEAVRRGIKKLFFLARDGYIMKQVYEICVKDEAIETEYLEVSRRSLRVPVLWMDCSYETILKMVVNAKLVTLESIFDGIGLEIDRYIAVIEGYGLKKDTAFDRENIRQDERLKFLLEAVRSDVVENSRREYEMLRRYLEERKVSGKFAVVDIGYGGSMQRYLQQSLEKLGIEHDVTGFYFAVADFYTKNVLPGIRLDLNGYLFDFQHDKNAVDTRSSFVGLFETLFLEQAGSVKKYATFHGKVCAERYPYEYAADGQQADALLKVKRIQQGAVEFAGQAAEDGILEMLKCRPEEYFYGLYETGTNPTLEELKLLGDLPFYDEGVTEQLAAPKRMLYYMVHPNALKIDFLRCRWKTGFLKRMLKIKFPYQKVYQMLRRNRQ